MIPIQILAQESLIGEHGDLLRKLRNLLKRLVELALTEFLRSAGNMSRFFEQTCSIRANVNAMGGSLAAQLFLNFGLDINNDRRRLSLSLESGTSP
jgi:hypothetical protein